MNRIIEFIKGLLRVAFSLITAFFAVLGASVYLGEKGLPDSEYNIVIGIIYGIAVLLLVNIGLRNYREATKKK